jgi:thiol-disulfide isomerase/thioredoxin
MKLKYALILSFFLSTVASAEPPASQPAPSVYRCTLESAGGELPFIMELSSKADGPEGWIINGSERIELPKIMRMREEAKVGFLFPHYDSLIEAAFDRQANTMRGTWSKRGAKDQMTQMPFAAEAYKGYRFTPKIKMTEEVVPSFPVAGRWSVQFASDKEPCVGIFKSGSGNEFEGTFLTTTGDYRFLAGSYEHGLLRLSCFDGSHAFLFHATMKHDGTLDGHFWSGPKFHDTWTAKRDDKAALPDGFTLTKVNPKAHLKDLKFHDLEGKEATVAGLLGKATVIEIFGSWCPNCHDAADLLVALEKRHGASGLKIIGLAFEASGDTERDSKQVKRYMARHGANYPVLLAGVKDRDKASAALPVIDGLKGYPSFLFVDANGEIRSTYTGFSGPATGEDYKTLCRQFDDTVRGLLSGARP